LKRQAEAWHETKGERVLRLADVVHKKLTTPPGINVSYELDLKGPGKALFKPKSGEAACRPSITPGTYLLREALAFRLDRMFGFNLVPVTVIRKVDGEDGSAQTWVNIDRWYIHQYTKLDQARMAVLDYVMGNTDRHAFNWRTQVDGRPAAVDNGLSLPRNASYPIRSKWVVQMLKTELPERVQTEVTQANPDTALRYLEEMGIEAVAADGFSRRLDELRSNGLILGTEWAGPIVAT